MDSSNYPSGYPENQSTRRDSRNLFIGLLLAALIGTLGYAIYSGSHHKSIQESQQVQIAKVVDEKGQLQKNFDDALVRLDSMTGANNKVQGVLADREKDIAKMKTEIRSILNKQKLSDAEKKKAQELITDLNSKITNMEQEIARLTEDNKNLTDDKNKLTQEKDQLTSDLQTTATAKDELAKKVDIASTFNATNIRVTAIQDKKNGEEKVTDKAKKVDKLKITFDLSNRIATDAQTDVYVCITGPDGKIVSVPAMGSGTFTTRDEGDKAFTTKVPVQYEAGKVMPITTDWKQDSGFQTGSYKIEIYHNGFKIGEATKELKKGGLFS